MTVAFFTIAWNFPDLFMLVPFTSNMYIVLGVAMALAYPILFGLIAAVLQIPVFLTQYKRRLISRRLIYILLFPAYPFGIDD